MYFGCHSGAIALCIQPQQRTTIETNKSGLILDRHINRSTNNVNELRNQKGKQKKENQSKRTPAKDGVYVPRQTISVSRSEHISLFMHGLNWHKSWSVQYEPRTLTIEDVYTMIHKACFLIQDGIGIFGLEYRPVLILIQRQTFIYGALKIANITIANPMTLLTRFKNMFKSRI